MKQIIQNMRSGALEVVEVPAPALRPGGVLVAVGASLLSAGTERMVVNLGRASLLGKARQRPDQVRQVISKIRHEGLLTTYRKVISRLDKPSPLGYACAGTVVAVGAGVTDLQPGDRVACAGGGYANHAELDFVPRNLAARLPERPAEPISFEEGAFATLGAIALQGLRQAEPSLGETVGVIGLGLIGLLAVQLLRANGCRVIGLDPNPARAILAEELGCLSAASDSAAFLTLAAQRTGGRGLDAVLITAGAASNEPLETAAEACRERGRVVAVGLVGLNVPRKPFYDKELDLRLSRSYGPGRYDPQYEEGGHDYPYGYVRWTENRNLLAFLEQLAQGRVEVRRLISHRFPIAEALQAYDLITGKRAVQALGVILHYPQSQAAVADTQPIWLSPAKPAAVPTAPSRASVHRQEPLRLGVVGTGAFAQGVLLPALRDLPGTQLRGVCSAAGVSARHAGQKFGALYCTCEASRLIGDPEIDAVLIATRHDSHAHLTVQALEAGKSVLCEKPLALNADQLRQILSVYQASLSGQKSPILCVGFNRRFSPMVVQLKAFLAQAGEPLLLHYRVNAGYLPPEHWLHDPVQGGGRLIGEGCHFVDLLTFLAGGLPLEVWARALPDAGRYRQDNLSVLIRFAGGSLATLTYSAGGDASFGKERLEVFGGGLSAALDDFRTLELGRAGQRRVQRAHLAQDKGHRAELAAFAEAVRSVGPAPIPLEELAAVSLATFRMVESLGCGAPLRVNLADIWPEKE